jgi:hypothetical protein
VGVSREAEGAIEDVFVNKLGAKYPLVKVDEKSVAPYGISFFPSVYVIDPDGNVFSVPDDRMPSEATIESLLARVSSSPKMPADKLYDPLRALWKKAEFLKVRDFLDKSLAAPGLADPAKAVYDEQRAHLDKKAEAAEKRIAALGAGPDFAASQEQLERIEKQWRGMAPATAAQKELQRFGADPAIKKELSAGKALQKLRSQFDPSRVAQRKKLAEALLAFAKKNPDTEAAKQAEAEAARLNGK